VWHKTRYFMALSALCLCCCVTAQAKSLSESQKIEALIKHVGELKAAAFVRNGKPHTPAEAARHMRDKWQWRKDQINTTIEFIEIAATKSSVSGKPYLIRFSDGKEVSSADYLREQLRKLEHPTDE
jgi:hypothetical protein